jgi:two-component system, OmpR family, KDP operon response regulator KdpE
MKPIKILAVDDEPQIRKLLQRGLNGYGYEVIIAADGQEALTLAAQQSPDVVVLDIQLQSRPDGVEVCHDLREWSATPIIILSVREDKKTKIAALNAGADDYLTKPFDMEELEARIRAILRRSIAIEADNPMSEIHIHDLSIDLVKRRVMLKGEEIHLTPKEYELLRLLAIHPGRVLTNRFLLDAIWNGAHPESEHYIRVFINTLRRKLQENISDSAHYIFTEPGVGYRFTDS